MIDAHGLLSAFVLDGSGGGVALDWGAVRAWQPAQGVLWLHLDRTDETVQHWIVNESGIDRASAESLLRIEGNRPRVRRVGEALLIALRGLNRNAGEAHDDMPAMHMWIEADRVVTLRRRRLLAGNRIREDLEAGRGPRGSSDFLVRMTDYLVEPVIPVVAELDDSIDLLQQEVLGTHGANLRHRLQHTRQEVINFRRHIAPQRDALGRLHGEQVAWLEASDRAHLREIADYTARYVEDLDAARERAGVAQDELNNRLAERMNRTMYLLTIVSAVLLPPSLLTGLFGINLGGMPGVESHTAFWIVTASIPMIAAVEIVILRHLRWI